MRGLAGAFLRSTMRSFARTPPAPALRRAIARDHRPAARDTFGEAYLSACAFEVGDRVCGVYVVAERRGEGEGEGAVVVLKLQPPGGWKGPVGRGFLGVGVVPVTDEESEVGEGERSVRFVSETVLWRDRDGQPSVLEGSVSGWLHELMVRWLVVRGVEAVTA